MLESHQNSKYKHTHTHSIILIEYTESMFQLISHTLWCGCGVFNPSGHPKILIGSTHMKNDFIFSDRMSCIKMNAFLMALQWALNAADFPLVNVVRLQNCLWNKKYRILAQNQGFGMIGLFQSKTTFFVIKKCANSICWTKFVWTWWVFFVNLKFSIETNHRSKNVHWNKFK